MEFHPVEGGDFGNLAQRLDGFIWTDASEFAKAVTAGYGTDVATFTGGRAVQLQSIEHSLLATVQEEKHFKAWRALTKSDATATVDEYVQQTTVGGFLGGSFNSEVGTISSGEADYKRRYLEIKYLMTMRTVSVVQSSTKGVVNVISNQTDSAIKQIMSDVEWGIFYGDSACSAMEFDGVEAILRAQTTSDHVIDLRGKPVTAQAAEFITSAQLVSSYGNFGTLTDAYMSNLCAADLDQKLDPGYRVNITSTAQNVKVGTPVTSIVTRWGNIAVNDDVFIREGDMPFASRSAALAAIAAAAGVTAVVTVNATAAPNASSQFLTAHAGIFYWAAESGNKNGRALTIAKTTATTVAAGDGVTVDVTEPAGGNETYYMLYRSRRNGTNASTDLREMIRLPKTGGGTTTYIDVNQNIPGTSKIFCLTQREDAITIRRLLGMMKFALYPSNTPVIPWAHLLFLALRVGKPNQHTIIINVLPAGASWQPF